MRHPRHPFPLAATLAVSVLAACGGGGTTGSSLPATTLGSSGATASASPTPTPKPSPSPSPSPSPTAVATAVPAAAPVTTAQLAGSAGFVNAQAHTIYVFDADLAAPGTSTCSGQCAAVWPSVSAVANASYPAPFSAIKRSDGTSQLAYAGRPLYTYIADSAAGSVAGDGITSFGAAWHIARPASVSAGAPTPAATTTPAGGY